MINLPSGHHICFLAENQASPHISWLQSYEIKKKKKKTFLISNFYEKDGLPRDPCGDYMVPGCTIIGKLQRTGLLEVRE